MVTVKWNSHKSHDKLDLLDILIFEPFDFYILLGLRTFP